MDNVDQSNRQSVSGTRGVDQQFQAAALLYVVNELVLNGATGQTEVLLLLDEGCHPSPAACSTIHHQPGDFKVKELSA